MGTDLPLTSPLSGAIVRGIRKVIFIRSRLLMELDRAGDLRAGRQSTRGPKRVSTLTADVVGNATPVGPAPRLAGLSVNKMPLKRGIVDHLPARGRDGTWGHGICRYRG